MSKDKEILDNITEKEYEHGFVTNVEQEFIPKGLNEDIIRLISAKKNEPDNASLYYVEGNIYKELKNVEKAVESYYKCAEINPEYEFGYIGAGILYYNLALEYQEKATNEFDNKKYEELVEQFNQALKNALEPFEKAYSISKDNSLKVNVAEYLKNIYYRFSSVEDKYMQGYNKFNEYVKANAQ